jgi:hypothetical protein
MHERATPELPVDVQMLPLAFSQLRAAVLLGALATIRTGLTARIGDTRGRTVARRLAGSSLCHRVIALAQQQSNVEWCSAAGSHEAQPHPPTMMREASRSAALLMRRTIFTACRRSVRWMGSATCVRGRLTGWEHAWLGDSGHSARSASARGAEIDLHSVTLPCRLFAMGAREWPCATLPRISGVLGRGMRIFTRFFSAVSDAGMRWDNGTPASPARPDARSPNSIVGRHNINTRDSLGLHAKLFLARAPPHCSLTSLSASLCISPTDACVSFLPRASPLAVFSCLARDRTKVGLTAMLAPHARIGTRARQECITVQHGNVWLGELCQETRSCLVCDFHPHLGGQHRSSFLTTIIPRLFPLAHSSFLLSTRSCRRLTPPMVTR